jgi:hypothetical protein
MTVGTGGIRAVLHTGRAMRILALEIEAPDAAAGAFLELARAEATALWTLVQAGIVRETYFRSDRTAAVLLLECDDLDRARDHLGTLPMVSAGLIRFELIGLRPYPGFGRLFAPVAAADPGSSEGSAT